MHIKYHWTWWISKGHNRKSKLLIIFVRRSRSFSLDPKAFNQRLLEMWTWNLAVMFLHYFTFLKLWTLILVCNLGQKEFGFVQNQKLMQLKWADSIWERRELSNWRNVEIRPLSSLFPSCLFTLGVSAQLTLPSLYYAAMLCSCFLEQKRGEKF